MLVLCGICQEIYTPCSVVHVTNCGHLYHANCLSTWTKHHRTCPQCRTNLTRPFRIYFDVERDEETEIGTPERQVEVLQHKLREAGKSNKKLLDEKKSFEKIVADLNDRNSYLITKNEILKASACTLKAEVARSNNYKNMVTVLEKEAVSLKAKIAVLERINTLIEGSSEEVNKLVDSTPVTSLAVKQLCLYVSVLKSQLNKMESKNHRLAKENRDISRALAEEKEKSGTEVLIKNLEAKNKKLEEDLNSLNETFANYKKKYAKKLKSFAPLRSSPYQDPSKTKLPDVNIDEFLEEENLVQKVETKQKTETVRPAEPDRTIKNWEEIIFEGKHIPGFSKTKGRTFGTVLNDDINEASSSGAGYAFDGLGGRKKIRLGGPTPVEEFEKLKQKKAKKEARGHDSSRHKKTPECIEVE